MARDDVRVELHEAEIDALQYAPTVREGLLVVGGEVAAAAARDAPKRTGAGAASIHPEAVDEAGGVTVRVGWDRQHFYLYFHHEGTERGGRQVLPPDPFLTQALDRYAQL